MKSANYLATKGFYVYTYDYRDIGESKYKPVKDSTTSYNDWGSIDFPAITEKIRSLHPQKAMYLIGHSFGGSCIGMTSKIKEFDKF